MPTGLLPSFHGAAERWMLGASSVWSRLVSFPCSSLGMQSSKLSFAGAAFAAPQQPQLHRFFRGGRLNRNWVWKRSFRSVRSQAGGDRLQAWVVRPQPDANYSSVLEVVGVALRFAGRHSPASDHVPRSRPAE